MLPTRTRSFEVKGNFTSNDPNDPNVQQFWALEPQTDTVLYEMGQKCWELNGDILFYVGTAAVVRDIIGMTELLDGPGSLVNYWGFRYVPLFCCMSYDSDVLTSCWQLWYRHRQLFGQQYAMSLLPTFIFKLLTHYPTSVRKPCGSRNP